MRHRRTNPSGRYRRPFRGSHPCAATRIRAVHGADPKRTAYILRELSSSGRSSAHGRGFEGSGRDSEARDRGGKVPGGTFGHPSEGVRTPSGVSRSDSGWCVPRWLGNLRRLPSGSRDRARADRPGNRGRSRRARVVGRSYDTERTDSELVPTGGDHTGSDGNRSQPLHRMWLVRFSGSVDLSSMRKGPHPGGESRGRSLAPNPRRPQGERTPPSRGSAGLSCRLPRP